MALADYGANVNLITSHHLRSLSHSLVFDRQPAEKPFPLDLQGNPLEISERVLLRVRANRAQPRNGTNRDFDIWFDVWFPPGNARGILFGALALEELGFYIANRHEESIASRFDPTRPQPGESRSEDILAMLTSPAAIHEHVSRVNDESSAALQILRSRFCQYLGVQVFDLHLADVWDSCAHIVLRTDLVPGDGIRGTIRYKSEASEHLVRPAPMHGYPPQSVKHRCMLKLIAYLVNIGVMEPADSVSQYAFHAFLVGNMPRSVDDKMPRMVVNTAAAATNIKAVPAQNHVNLMAQVRRQEGLRKRIKLDIKGAFHLNIIAEGQDQRITQIRYGGLAFNVSRTIMGEVNSAEFLNRVLDEIFGDLEWLSRWMDDMLVGGCDEIQLAKNFSVVLKRCADHGVILSISKVEIGDDLFWCGMWFGPDTIKPDTNTVNIITSIARPDSGADLAQLIGSVEWLSKFIPDHARLLRPLRLVMESIYTKAASRENKAVKRFKVDAYGWDFETDRAFADLKAAIVSSKKLIIRDSTKALVMHTDASQTGWACILLQCPHDDLVKSVPDRAYELLECCGGLFPRAMQFWKTVEQEGFAVVYGLERLWHIIGDGSRLHIFTDNEALSSIFDMTSKYVNSKDKPSQARLVRWAARLLSVNHEINHVAGSQNTFADLISRLKTFPADTVNIELDTFDVGGPAPTPLESTPTAAAVQLSHHLRTVTDKDWVPPTADHIRAYIGTDGRTNSVFLKEVDTLKGVFDSTSRLWMSGDRIIIPDAPNLRNALIVTVHCGPAGHRSAEVAFRYLSDKVCWKGMREDVADAIKKCIHCLEARPHHPERPWGTPIIPVRRNQILCFDHLHLGQSERGWVVVLVVTDKLTSFTKLYPMAREDALSTSEALQDWIATFGKPEILMSDGGPAFKNLVIASLTSAMAIDHHFVTAYSSWANGKQERLNYTIGNAFRAMLSENLMTASHWPSLVPIVQSIINQTPTASLDWVSPSQAFLACEPTNPISSFVDQKGAPHQVKWEQPEILACVTQWRAEAAAREIFIHDAQVQRNAHLIDRQTSKGRAKAFVGEIGDYVMVRNPDKHLGKLDRRWRGPAEIISIDSDAPTHVLTVRYLGDQGNRSPTEKVHVSRVQFFDIASMPITKELIVHAETTSQVKHIVARFSDVRKVEGKRQFELEVHWEGYPMPTWHPMVRLSQDVPEMVAHFLSTDIPDSSKHLLPEVLKVLPAAVKRLVKKEGSVTIPVPVQVSSE